MFSASEDVKYIYPRPFLKLTIDGRPWPTIFKFHRNQVSGYEEKVIF